MIIAAVAERNGCTVVTDNARDFAGIAFINPMRAGRKPGGKSRNRITMPGAKPPKISA
jgi:hypothetical protein